MNATRVVATEAIYYQTTATEMYSNRTFTKKFWIPIGAKGTLFKEEDRDMIRLDIPIMSENEEDAPYESLLYRIFIYHPWQMESWEVIND